MRTTDRIWQLLGSRLQDVHGARVRQVFALAEALLRGGQATLTSIGRAAATSTTEKHGIKRADRCVGSAALHAEVLQFWRALAFAVLARSKQPWILVDWSEAGPGFAALRAAVVLQGRAVSIFSRVYRSAAMGNSAVQGRFLKSLQKVLPEGCCPILVTDAGFQGTWFDQVRALGWQFVGRLRSKICVRPLGQRDWIPVAQLERNARRVHVDCGEFEVVKRRRYVARIISFDGRTRRAVSSRRRRRRNYANKNAARARHPLVVVTSVPELSAERITSIYRSRMQIEETFRDDKSRRYGWGFELARSRKPRRIEVLLLLVAIATLTAAAIGLATIALGEQRHYQANTTRSRAVLSVVALGRRVLAHLQRRPDDRIPRGLRELRATLQAAHAV